jgi:oxygen-dependent protoporphyrinogen oxidase
MRAGCHVIVIGAGLAGLAAARRLRERECQVTLLERSDRAGGRASSEEREGFCFDSGAHQVCATDRNLLGLIASAGLEEQFLPLRPFRLAQVRGGESLPIDPVGLLGGARLPGVRLHEALRLARLARILRRFRGILDPHRPESAARLDDRSIADFTRLYFGASVLEAWVAPFAADSSLCDPDSTSRVLFLLRCVARGYAPAGTLRSGLADLAQALVPGDATRLGADVRALEPAGERITVHCAQADGERSIDGDAVVIATPAPVARGIADPLLETAERGFLARARHVAAIVVAVALDRTVVGCATRTRIPASEGWPVAIIAVQPGGAGAPAPEGKELALLIANERFSRTHLEESDEIVERDLVGLLQRLHPGSSSAVRFSAVRRHPRAYPRFDVGRYREIARFRKLERDLRAEGRRLYFAGDYLVDPSLEGAVTSGLRAADQILRDFGIATRAARPGAPGSSRPLNPPASPP